MQLRTRRTLFFISLIIFFIASPAAIMYSLGYKLDLTTFKIEKTGGIFVDIDYDDYTISLDKSIEKTVSKAIFRQQGTLLPNLIPKLHNVEISKNDYKPWKKTLEIKSGIVTEIKNVFLTPSDLSPSRLDENVNDFSLSRSKENMAYIKNNSLFSLNIKNNEKTEIELPPTQKSDKLSIIDQSFNQSIIYLQNDKNILKINTETKNIDSIKKPTKKKYLKILPSPKNNDSLFLLSSDDIIYDLDVENDTRSEIAKDVNNFYVTGESIIYTTNDPTNFYKQKIGSQDKAIQITFSPMKDVNEDSKILVRFDDPVAVLNSANELLLFNYSTEKFEKLAENIIDASISDDFSKMLYRNDHEIYVYYFEASYPQKKAGDKELLGRFSKEIQDASWFDLYNHHIFLTINDKTNILELDGRNKRNSEEIMEKPDKFIYNNYDKNIYLLKNNTLQKIPLVLDATL